MSRNRVRFQNGYRVVQFMDEYGTQDKSREAVLH